MADENGIELSVEEAEAYLDENADIELDEEMLDQAAGGSMRKKSVCNSKKAFSSYL